MRKLFSKMKTCYQNENLLSNSSKIIAKMSDFLANLRHQIVLKLIRALFGAKGTYWDLLFRDFVQKTKSKEIQGETLQERQKDTIERWSCFGVGGVELRIFTAIRLDSKLSWRGWSLSSSCLKFQLEASVWSLNSTLQLDASTRCFNAATQSCNSKLQLEILTRCSNSKLQLKTSSQSAS